MGNNINRAKLSKTYCTDDKTKDSCDVFIDQCATQHEQICMGNDNAKECMEQEVNGKFTLELSTGKNIQVKSSRMCYIMSPRLAQFYNPKIKKTESDTADKNEPVKQKPKEQKKSKEVVPQKEAPHKEAKTKKNKKTSKASKLQLSFKSKIEIPKKRRVEIYKILKETGFSGKATIRSYSHKKDNVTHVFFEITIVKDGERTTIESSNVTLKPGATKLSEKQWDKVLGEIRGALDGTTEEEIMDESLFNEFQ